MKDVCMQVIVTRHEWTDAPSSVKQLRREVFIEEQDVPESLEWDESDAIAQHFLASIDGKFVAVARLIICDGLGKIGRIAVSKAFRGKGIAPQLILEIMREGLTQGCTEFYLSAQTQAQSLYQKLGFFYSGETYLDAGIEHIDMFNKSPTLIANLYTQSIKTQSPNTPNKLNILNQKNFILGADSNTHRFSAPSECKDLATTLICQSKNTVKILSHHLNSEIFDNENIREALSKLARTNPRCEIQFLIADERPLVQRSHRLIELMRRLPSRISLRTINKNYPYDESSMTLIDREAVIFQKENSIYDGFSNFNDAGRNKQLSEVFNTLWSHAAESQELRQLKL